MDYFRSNLSVIFYTFAHSQVYAEYSHNSMKDFKQGCVFCGHELSYLPSPIELECAVCHKLVYSLVHCPEGHYICDDCHAKGGMDFIEAFCTNSKSTEVIEMAEQIMQNKGIKMHGPEHHFIVPAVLLTAVYNLKGEKDKIPTAVKEARRRASFVPGGFCGSHGSCGAGIGSGIFLSIFTGASPLSGREWQLSNMLTSECLLEIAKMGGPRCCKRDTFISLGKSIAFLSEHFDIHLPKKETIHCDFHQFNRQCLDSACVFNPASEN